MMLRRSALSWPLLVASSAAFASIAFAEQVKCPCVADVAVSHASKEEENASGGRTNRLKLKIHQELALMAFDLSALKGRKVVAAELYLCPIPYESKFVPGRPTDLRWIQISTVSSPWREGSQARSHEPDPEGHGATFREASYQREPWAWPGSTVAHVINGHSNSLYCANELTPAEAGYWKVSVDPALVHVLLAGGGHGLSVMDGSATHQVNPHVASRENQGREPYLLVTVEGDNRTPPQAPANVKARPAPDYASAERGAAAISLTAPRDAVAYAVSIDSKPVEPWQAARPAKPGSRQRIVIEDLPADKELSVEIAAVDGAGNRSDVVKVQARTSPAASVPKLPAVPFKPEPGEPLRVAERLRLWAFPEADKVDPVSGQLLFAPEAKDFDRANPVWSGKERLIRLAAARGEIAAFQFAFQTDSQPLEVTLIMPNLLGPGGAIIPVSSVKLFRVWYVKAGERWQGEYAIPLPTIPDAGSNKAVTSLICQVNTAAPDNAVPDQKVQAVYVDIPIPKDVPPGKYEGILAVKPGLLGRGFALDVTLKVVVYPAVIPDELTFNPELNCYGGPAKAGTPEFFDYHRLAHYNRCTLNRLPYNQQGQVHADMVPRIEGAAPDLRVVDWEPYDHAVGPLLDGSAFPDNPRAGVPVRALYLPFHENWPLTLASHYRMGSIRKPERGAASGLEGEDFPGQVDRALARRSPEFLERKERHDLLAPPIGQAFTDDYVQGNVAIVRQFVEHFREKGWTRTEAQIYQNNKYTWGGTWWTLDEPVEWTDFAALAYFSSIYHKGFAGQAGTRFVYRGDISRPEWMGSTLDGLMEVIYFNSGSADERRLARRLIERMPTSLRVYGRCNDVDRNNLESAAWCLSSLIAGGEGVLPWKSLGKEDALVKPNALALLIPGKRFGVTAIASTRVLAMRHGAQQCELLRLLLKKNNWQPEHAALLIAQKVPLASLYPARFADEAAARLYGRLTSANFLELKEGLLQLLAQPETTTRP